MDESRAFLEKAKSKLVSSKALYEIGQYGDSVGRSYYAMFLSAKALLVRDGYEINSHKSLISIFGREYVKNGNFDNDIAKYLSGTQSLREMLIMMRLIQFPKILHMKELSKRKSSLKKLKEFYNLDNL